MLITGGAGGFIHLRPFLYQLNPRRVLHRTLQTPVLKNDSRDGEPYLNPLWLMFASKARGSSAQIRQLAGMR